MSPYFTEGAVVCFNYKVGGHWNPESVTSPQRGPFSEGARWLLRADSKTSQIGCITVFVTVCWKADICSVDFGLRLAFSGANIG